MFTEDYRQQVDMPNPELVPIKTAKGAHSRFAGHYFVIKRAGMQTKYVHADGSVHWSTGKGEVFPGWFATEEAAEAAIKLYKEKADAT